MDDDAAVRRPDHGPVAGDAASGSINVPPTPPPPPPRRRRTLPALLNRFNRHDLKTLVRCWVAVWAALLLVLIGPVLRSIGIATFFASLVLFIIPPAGIVFGYLLAGLSALVGMCLAWAWGVITIKAALAARPEADTMARVQQLRQQAAVLANQTQQPAAAEAQVLVLNGFMLDTRVTVVYYVMACVFIYALARMRCSNPKLVAFQLFGTIITDVVLLNGPLLSSFNGTLPVVLIKPGAIGVGIGVACCLVFFPQSTSYVVLDSMMKLVRMAETSMAVTRKRLAGETASLDELKAAKMQMITVYEEMEPTLAFLPLDFSRGRWNADDVKSLQEPIRIAMLTSASLLDLFILRISLEQKEERLGRMGDDEKWTPEKDHHDPGHRELQESAALLNAFTNPEDAMMHARAREALADTVAEVLRLCSESIALAANYIHTVNSRRWIRVPSQATYDELGCQLQQTLDSLRTATNTCTTKTTEAVLNCYTELFDQHGELKPHVGVNPNALRGLVISMVVEERILAAAFALDKLLDRLLHLNTSRTRHRIWFPSRLRYAVSWILNGRLTVPVAGKADIGEDPDSTGGPDSLEEQAKEAHRRLRVSRGHYGTAARRKWLSRSLYATYHWLFNSYGLYALRMVVVTVALSVPAAISSSAGFFYREKGIWGVISAQTCLLVYMADFTFALVSRGVGTVIGGVMAMVAWYIGAGSGPGSSYGIAAIAAVMMAIIMWWRLFLPPAFTTATAMTGATFVLIIGFSWDQSHIPQYGLPGIGYEAFWKRLVVVLVGFAAAFIVQLFPKPPSASVHVRKVLANTVRTLSDHYALLLSHWGRTDKHSPLSAVAEHISLDIAKNLMSLNGPIALLKIEMSFGSFDQKLLRRTQEHCQYMNQALGRLLDLSTKLPKELQDRLGQAVGITDDRTVGDIMAVLSIVEQSLRTGSPLPERLPTPLVRRFFGSWQANHRKAMLSKTLIRDEDYRRYCVAMSSYIRFLSTIDDLVLVFKGALGECHVIHQWEDA